MSKASSRPVIPLIDPSANVKDALEAAVKRIDDIIGANKDAEKEMREMRKECEHEIAALREMLAEKESERLDAVGSAERSRIDALFLKNASDLALASEKQAAAQAVIANQLVASTEVLRASAAALDARTQASIRTLEQQQFQGAGRDAGTLSQRTESRAGSQWAIYLALAFLALFNFILGVAVFVMNMNKASP